MNATINAKRAEIILHLYNNRTLRTITAEAQALNVYYDQIDFSYDWLHNKRFKNVKSIIICEYVMTSCLPWSCKNLSSFVSVVLGAGVEQIWSFFWSVLFSWLRTVDHRSDNHLWKFLFLLQFCESYFLRQAGAESPLDLGLLFGPLVKMQPEPQYL